MMTPESPCSNKTPPPEIDMGRNRSYTVAPIYIMCVCVCARACVRVILLQQNVLILSTSEVYVMVFLTHC